MVTCNYCHSVVTKSEDVVQRIWFQQANLRAQERATHLTHGQVLSLDGVPYEILSSLGKGSGVDVYLFKRVCLLPELVTVKLALTPDKAQALEAEADNLTALSRFNSSDAAYFSCQLPELIGLSQSEHGQRVLLLRHPCGYWGSLADVSITHPNGIDPRHMIWMWRRALAVLDYIHRNGWAHGHLSPHHFLIHPRDHGIRIIGWSRAKPHHSEMSQQVIDLQQVAWTMRIMLCGQSSEIRPPRMHASVPSALSDLLIRASEDGNWVALYGAKGIDQALVDVAHKVYGAPQYLHFDPVKE